MYSSLKKAVKSLRRRFWYSPLGYGFPVPATSFNNEYRSGHWDLLLEANELHRYMVILGQIIKEGNPGMVLDVGCGSGRLAALLRPYHSISYLGIDFSKEAIDRARSLNLQSSQFQLADFEKWEPSGFRANYIIFNESIGYARDPLETCLKYHSLLEPNGKLIISYYRSGNYKAIWDRIGRKFAMHSTVSIRSENGSVWDVAGLSLAR